MCDYSEGGGGSNHPVKFGGYETWKGDYWHRTNGHAVVYRESARSIEGAMDVEYCRKQRETNPDFQQELENEAHRRNMLYGFE